MDSRAGPGHNAGTQTIRMRPERMKQFFLQFFTWWNGQTLGMRFFTWRIGEKVGADEFGNTYYRTRGGKIDPALGHERRWVIYNGLAEASNVPPGWNGWLHHTVDVAPADESYQPRAWQMPHKANMTGTAMAYRPPGSAVTSSAHPKAEGAYKAWTPGG
jgi:NADH:ubiquinone oxidoreductase subunit